MKEVVLKSSGVSSAVIITTIVLVVCFFIPYAIITTEDIKEVVTQATIFTLIIYLIMFLFGLFIHELIHAIFFIIFNKEGLESVRFGISKDGCIAPYCELNEDLLAWKFRICTIVPTLVLGVIPVVMSFVEYNFLYLLGGSLFIIAGSADIYLLWITRKITNRSIIKSTSDKNKLYYND